VYLLYVSPAYQKTHSSPEPKRVYILIRFQTQYLSLHLSPPRPLFSVCECMWVIGHRGKCRKCSYGKDSASENSWCFSSKQREYFPSLRTVSDERIKETIPARTSGWSTSQIIVLYDAQRIDGDKAPQCFVQLTVILSTMQKNIPLTLLI